ncbi:MAG TPA: hypothetical protein VK157_12555 [Phycisphaerales bacterium]|nr:hypothetical protein [Phycisphaerales bacterium]
MANFQAIPRFLLRRAIWCSLAVVIISLAAAFFLPAFSASRRGMSTFLVLLLAAITAPVLIYAMSLWSRRFVAKVHARDYRVCWKCGYDLRDLQQQGICPECGSAFTMTELREKWSRFERETAGTSRQPPA